jgi:hypothetical protein
LLAVWLLTGACPTDAKDPGSTIAIGDRRELLVDGFLVDKLSGGARVRIHGAKPCLENQRT